MRWTARPWRGSVPPRFFRHFLMDSKATGSCCSSISLTICLGGEKRMIPRLRYAMAAYAVLALLAVFTLDGKLRLFVLLLMGVLAFKSWIGAKMRDNSD